MRFIQNRRLRTIPLSWVVALCLVLGSLATIGAVQLIARQSNPIPSGIRSQVNFAVFIPDSYVAIDGGSYKYDPTAKVLSFTGRLRDGQTVTFAEQATPEPFSDIQNFYPQFLHTLNDYSSFDTYEGAVYLTHPKDAGQAAVMNAKGTLVFGRVGQDESRATWQEVFNHLSVYQP